MKKALRNISIDRIKQNPDNPRIIFRPEELDNLFVSIKKFGVQVPITVYEEKDNYVLIDGERRWRTCRKLNLEKIPAIVNPKPSKLDNLLMMFNIHSLREQWDFFTIANKLTTVIELLEQRLKHPPNEIELSEETGLTRGAIRRCKMLIDLPLVFKEIILKELQKPKSKQKFTEDFFLEMEGALKTVIKNLPNSVKNIDVVRNILIEKYRDGVIDNIVDFRKIARIATAPKNLGYDENNATKALTAVFSRNDQSIDEVYNQTVSVLYGERKLISNFSNVLNYIRNLNEEERKDKEIREALINIKYAIEEILK